MSNERTEEERTNGTGRRKKEKHKAFFITAAIHIVHGVYAIGIVLLWTSHRTSTKHQPQTTTTVLSQLYLFFFIFNRLNNHRPTFNFLPRLLALLHVYRHISLSTSQSHTYYIHTYLSIFLHISSYYITSLFIHTTPNSEGGPVQICSFCPLRSYERIAFNQPRTFFYFLLPFFQTISREKRQSSDNFYHFIFQSSQHHDMISVDAHSIVFYLHLNSHHHGQMIR